MNFVEQYRSSLNVGRTRDEALRELRDAGASPIDGIKAIREVDEVGLAEAKRRFSESPSWADYVRQNDALIEEELKELERSRRRIWHYPLLAATLLFVIGCASLIRDPSLPLITLESLPVWLAVILVSILGPVAILEIDGSGVVFAAVVACVLLCLTAARILWRRWPEAEWFAVPLALAAVVWSGSFWILVFMHLT